jgi:hypothetical protein
MQSACVSSRSSAARRPGSSRPGLEHLECRNVPGSTLRLSTPGADLGVLYQAALAPATQFEDLAQATRGAAVQAPANVAGGGPAPAQALAFDNPFHQQALQDVLSGGLLAGRAQAPSGLQAALGTDALSQAVQAFVSGGKAALGSLKGDPGTPGAPLPPPNVIADPFFSSLGVPGSPWTVGVPSDPYVFAGMDPTGRPEAVLGTVGGVNTVTQVGIFTPNPVYTISFDWANDDPTGGPSQIAVEWNGAVVGPPLFNLVNPPPSGYATFPPTPMLTTTPFSTLTIIERNDPSFFHITNMSAV